MQRRSSLHGLYVGIFNLLSSYFLLHFLLFSLGDWKCDKKRWVRWVINSDCIAKAEAALLITLY
jgi:hypothetical protein